MRKISANNLPAFIGIGIISFILINSGCNSSKEEARIAHADSIQKSAPNSAPPKTIDTVEYNRRMVYLSNGDTTGRWPIKGAPYPLPGAILPFNRIVAYYGNLYSK